jgi:hypothetical protein
MRQVLAFKHDYLIEYGNTCSFMAALYETGQGLIVVANKDVINGEGVTVYKDKPSITTLDGSMQEAIIKFIGSISIMVPSILNAEGLI